MRAKAWTTRSGWVVTVWGARCIRLRTSCAVATNGRTGSRFTANRLLSSYTLGHNRGCLVWQYGEGSGLSCSVESGRSRKLIHAPKSSLILSPITRRGGLQANSGRVSRVGLSPVPQVPSRPRRDERSPAAGQFQKPATRGGDVSFFLNHRDARASGPVHLKQPEASKAARHRAMPTNCTRKNDRRPATFMRKVTFYGPGT